MRPSKHRIKHSGCLVGKSEKRKCESLSRVGLFVIPWTVARQAPVSMGFSRQEYWNGWPFPSQRELPDPGIEPGSPALQVDSFPLNHISYLVPYQFLLVKEAQEHCSVTTLQSWSGKRASTKAREIINEVHNFQ